MLRMLTLAVAAGLVVAGAVMWAAGFGSPPEPAPTATPETGPPVRAATPAGLEAAPPSGPAPAAGAGGGQGSRRADPPGAVSEPSGPVGHPAATRPTAGPYPVSTNNGTGPARKLAGQAAALLRAELTGSNRGDYEQLEAADPPCCTGFRVRGAAVVFAEPIRSGPARVTVTWRAQRRQAGGPRRGTTTVRMRPTSSGWQPAADVGR